MVNKNRSSSSRSRSRSRSNSNKSGMKRLHYKEQEQQLLAGMKRIQYEEQEPEHHQQLDDNRHQSCSTGIVHEALTVGLSRLINAYNDSYDQPAPIRPEKAVSRIPKAIREDLVAVAQMFIATNPTSSSYGDDDDQDESSADDVDPDEYIDYARDAIERGQNRSSSKKMPFDDQSFKDFESLLEESIQSHFLDDDDDDDSLNSDSSYSGYDNESGAGARARSTSQRTNRRRRNNIYPNSLIPEALSSRRNGQIARPRRSHNDSGSRRSHNGDTDSDCSYSTCTETTTASRISSSLPSHILEAENEDDDSDSDESTLATELTESTVTTGTSRSTVTATGGAVGSKKYHRSSKRKDANDPTAYLRRYEISDMNSLVSENSYSPSQLEGKKRTTTRIRKSRLQPNVNSTLDSENAWDNVEHTASDLARVVHMEQSIDDENGETSTNSIILDGVNHNEKENGESKISQMVQDLLKPYDTIDSSSKLVEEDYSPSTLAGNNNNEREGTGSGSSSHHGDDVTDNSNNSVSLDERIKSIKVACATPDKVYEADKSTHQHESLFEDSDRVNSSGADSKDVISDISESFMKPSPSNQRPPLASSPSTMSASATLTDSSGSRRVSNTMCDDSGPSSSDTASITPSLNISVDSGHIFLPSTDETEDDAEPSMVGSSVSQSQDYGWEIDEMIEGFLNHKIETLQERMVEQQMELQEQQEIRLRRDAMIKELKAHDGSIVQRARLKLANGYYVQSNYESSPIQQEDFSRVKRAASPLKGFKSRSYWHERIRHSAERRAQMNSSSSKVHPQPRRPLVDEGCAQPLDERSSTSSSIQKEDSSHQDSTENFEDQILSKDENCGVSPNAQVKAFLEDRASPYDGGCCMSESSDDLKENLIKNPKCIEGRDLIRRVHTKREMIVKARNSRFGNASISKQNISPPTSEEELLETYLNPKSHVDTKKTKLLNKAKRRSILRSQKQPNREDEQMLHPLQAPIESDSSVESIPNVSLLPATSSVLTVKSLRFGRNKKGGIESPTSYEALSPPPEESSFVAAGTDSESIMEALAPPSPQSPIRGYFCESSDASDAFQAALDFSQSFGSPSAAPAAVSSSVPSDAFGDSFDEIVLRRNTPTNPTTQDGWGEDLFAGKGKISPKSVDGFFDVFQPILNEGVSPSKGCLSFDDASFPTAESSQHDNTFSTITSKSSGNIDAGWGDDGLTKEIAQTTVGGFFGTFSPSAKDDSNAVTNSTASDADSAWGGGDVRINGITPTQVGGFFGSFSPETKNDVVKSANTPKTETTDDGCWGEKIVITRDEVSPTSVAGDGFFDPFVPVKTGSSKSSLAFVDEDTPDPVFVDEDEFNTSEDKLYQQQLENGITTGFVERRLVEPAFVSPSRFEI